jgi:flagellar motor switch protein FliG
MAAGSEKSYSGLEKAAIIMLSASEENATQIFSLMTEEEIKEVSYAMSNLGSINAAMLDKLIGQFTYEISGDASFLGNLQTTEKLLEKVMGKDRSAALIDEIRGPQGKNTWEKLGGVSEEILAGYLRNEFPQTAALVLTKINSDHAARILSILPEKFSFEVMVRMLNMGAVKKEVLDRVEKILRGEFISSITKSQKYDRYELMAEIFNKLDRHNEERYMGLLEKQHPEYAEKIKDLMFTFDDLSNIDPKGIQVLLRAIDKSKLTIALKGASAKVKDLFLSNMSQRASKILLEEMESLGPIKVKDVDEAQFEIIAVAKEMIGKGEIEISEGGEEEYIS